ncbi:imm11 family protein [Aliikangiella maris]|uniref:DUF1629 domain-containing protein n=2 Tax=Aliikangiella maris TaxID=3162458 RepID=A0ABV2BTN8_9GAMM
MSYWVLFSTNFDDGVYLKDEPERGPEDFEYFSGKTLINSFPTQDQAIMKYHPEYTTSPKLHDFVESMNRFHIINNKVRSVFEKLKLSNLEYLPISIKDNNQQLVSQDYYILNPLGSVNFIDMEKSEYTIDDFDETQIDFIQKLIAKKDIPESARLFRASTMMDRIFIHDDVKEALEAENITGYKLMPADGWEGFDF